jgi:hypothetical protein
MFKVQSDIPQNGGLFCWSKPKAEPLASAQLVRDLLQRDPEFRPSASEVLLSKLPSLMVQFEKRFRLILKGSLTQDFRLQVFFMNQCPPGPQVFHWCLFEFFSKILGDICEFMFITGVKDTGDKLFSGVNDTGKKFIAGVVDTGEQFKFPRCRSYHSEKN